MTSSKVFTVTLWVLFALAVALGVYLTIQAAMPPEPIPGCFHLKEYCPERTLLK